MAGKQPVEIQEEERLALLSFALNNVHEAAFLVDERARFHFVNEEACRILGYSREELLSLTVHDIDPDFPPERWPEHWRQIAKEKSQTFEGHHKAKDGRIFLVEISVNFFEYGSGQYNLALVRDISERKRVEEELASSEAKYRRFVETANEGICSLDGDVRIAYVNDRTCEMIGYSCDEMLGRPLSDFMFEEDVAGFEERMAARRKGVPENYEYRFRRKDGSELWLLISASAIEDDEGKFQGSFGMLTDITERRLAERRIAESEKKFRSLAESLPDNIVRYDRQGRTIYVNPTLEKTLGFPASEMIGKRIRELNPDGSYEEYAQAVDNALASGENGEIELVAPDGTGKTIHQIRIIVERDEQGEVSGILAIGRDISERKRAEEELASSEEKFSRSFYAAPNLMAITRPEDGQIIDINESFCRFFGYTREECIGRSTAELKMWVNPEQRDVVVRKLKETGEVLYANVELRTKSGEIRSVIDSIVYINIGNQKYLLSVATDVTERKRAEERLRGSLVETIRAMALTVEKRDPYTAGHQTRVAQLCVAIGTEIGLDTDRLEGLRLAATIVDIGKVNVPAEILNRPGKLREFEFEILKEHAQIGYEIIKDVEFPWPVAEMILQHHERLDGSGYPNGLKAPDILLESRILAVADVVEAMSSHRPYREALDVEEAMREIEANRGTKYDPEVVNACLHLFREGGFSFD